jgi:hypothetical protein
MITSILRSDSFMQISEKSFGVLKQSTEAKNSSFRPLILRRLKLLEFKTKEEEVRAVFYLAPKIQGRKS